MFELKFHTPQQWVDAVLEDFDAFLQDHAAAEKKASGMALSMLSHYPDKRRLVKAMTDLALEEMIHFKQVVKLLTERDINLGDDKKDPYVNQLRSMFRHGKEVFMLDRLLVAAVIEARGHERFALVAEALPAGKDKEFYVAIAKSEEKHKNLFVELALEYFDEKEVYERLEQVIVREAQICASLPYRAALH